MRKAILILFITSLLLTACSEPPAPKNEEALPEAEMTATDAPEAPAAQTAPEPEVVTPTPLRDPKAIARDQYRHPDATLAFFGLRPDMTVVELWPGGGGWYTAVLAPKISDAGQLIVASYPPNAESEYYRKSEARYRKELKAHPDVYGDVKIVTLMPPEFLDLGEPGSVDMVLTFRNLHNWYERGLLRQVFEAAYTVLKPGGVFGVAEHRAAEGVTMEEAAGSGYMAPDYVIGLAEDVGFKLAAKSEINANPKDTANHPSGVWTLPPGFALCNDMAEGPEKEACFEKYRAIGESDRMTLKFVKPE